MDKDVLLRIGDLIQGYMQLAATTSVTGKPSRASPVDITALAQAQLPLMLEDQTRTKRGKQRVTGDGLIVCLECGKHLKQLKYHLRTNHALTPQAYFEKHGLPPDSPVSSPASHKNLVAREAKRNKAKAAAE